MESEHAEGAWKFLGRIWENSLVFLLNNALVYMFLRLRNKLLKKECIWVRKRGAFLAKQGVPELNFHHEGGGAVAHICLLNLPLVSMKNSKECLLYLHILVAGKSLVLQYECGSNWHLSAFLIFHGPPMTQAREGVLLQHHEHKHNHLCDKNEEKISSIYLITLLSLCLLQNNQYRPL